MSLKHTDLEWLIQLKKKILKHLEDIYNVKEQEDQILIYSHFPYGIETITLHFHIRVNQAIHPLEKSRSFLLDDIIDALDKSTKINENPENEYKLNKGIINLIISRCNTGLFTSVSKFNDNLIAKIKEEYKYQEDIFNFKKIVNYLKIKSNDNRKIYQPDNIQDYILYAKVKADKEKFRCELDKYGNILN